MTSDLYQKRCSCIFYETQNCYLIAIALEGVIMQHIYLFLRIKYTISRWFSRYFCIFLEDEILHWKKLRENFFSASSISSIFSVIIFGQHLVSACINKEKLKLTWKKTAEYKMEHLSEVFYKILFFFWNGWRIKIWITHILNL